MICNAYRSKTKKTSSIALVAGGCLVMGAVPAAGEVLVRVHYASVNPVDWKLQEAGRLPFPATPGGDFAGEVVAVGPGVTAFACGRRGGGGQRRPRQRR